MEASRICLDTDVVIDYLRGHSDAVLVAALGFEAYITSITLFELQTADFLSERQRHLLQQVYQAVTFAPLDEGAARSAAEVARDLRVRGQPIGLEDIFIASICLSRQMPLLTRNTRHYQRITGLQLVSPDDLAAISV